MENRKWTDIFYSYRRHAVAVVVPYTYFGTKKSEQWRNCICWKKASPFIKLICYSLLYQILSLLCCYQNFTRGQGINSPSFICQKSEYKLHGWLYNFGLSAWAKSIFFTWADQFCVAKCLWLVSVKEASMMCSFYSFRVFEQHVHCGQLTSSLLQLKNQITPSKPVTIDVLCMKRTT